MVAAQSTLRELVLEATRAPEPQRMRDICALVMEMRPGTAAETVRARVYEHMNAGRILRVAEGVYVAVDGPARLLLVEGDAWEVLRGLPAESVNAIVTDPPYDLGTLKHVGRGSTKPHAKYGGAGRRSYEQRDLDAEWFREAFRVLRKDHAWNTLSAQRRARGDLPRGGGACILFAPWRTPDTREHIEALIRLAESCGFHYQGETAWDREVLGTGYAFGRDQLGLLLLFTAGKRRGIGWNLALRNVLRHRGGRPRRAGAHEAEKPAGLFLDLIEYVTRAGDVVLDCFAGAARWAREAVQRGRHVVLVEKDPKWVRAIARDFEVNAG